MRFMYKLLEYCLALLPGLMVFVIFVGAEKLDPSFVNWLLEGDLGAHQMSWQFFRNSEWQFPLGQMVSMFAPLSGNIALSDGLPLFALPAKLFTTALPPHFQYFGLWLFFCFLLNSFFGFKLATCFTKDRLQQFLIAGFFSFSPILLFRVGHASHCGHFFLLANIYAYLLTAAQQRFQARQFWIVFLTLGFSLLATPYLLAMSLGIALATLALTLWQVKEMRSKLLALLSVLSGLALALALAWSVGYLNNPSVQATDFEAFSVDLLAPLNSRGLSILLPALRSGWGQGEGFSYLGLGLIVLSFWLLWHGGHRLLKTSFIRRKWLPLGIAVLAFSFYSLTSHISFGGNQIIDLSRFYELISFLTQTLRTAGRFIWPAYYLLTLWLLVQMLGRIQAGNSQEKTRARQRWALFIVLFLQIVDLGPWAYRLFRNLNTTDITQYHLTNEYLAKNKFEHAIFYPNHFHYAGFSCPGPRHDHKAFIQTGLALAERGIVMSGGFSARIPVSYASLCELDFILPKSNQRTLLLAHKESYQQLEEKCASPWHELGYYMGCELKR